jgi:hypothetical protein
MGDTPKELQAELGDLAQDNASLNERLSAVEGKIGRITQRPTFGDRFRSAFSSKKNAPLAKLSDEREQILETMRANQKKIDTAKTKLDQLTQVKSPNVDSSRAQSNAPKTTVDATLHQSDKVVPPKPQVDSTTTRQQDPLRSQLGSGSYAPSLRRDSLSQDLDPLRSELGEGSYAPNLRPESRNRQQDPLRSELDQDAYAPRTRPINYAPSLQTDSLTQQVDALRSELGEDSYAPNLQPERVTRKQPQQSNVIDEDNPLRSNTIDEDRVQSVGLNPEEDELTQEVGPKFKMKPMEQLYVDKEKQTPSITVQVNGQNITVKQKEWALDSFNEELKKRNMPPVTKDQWERAGLARVQPNTQYFNEQQRAEHQVSLDNGGVKNKSGESLKEGDHIFVMDEHGRFYTQKESEANKQLDSTGKRADVHHSSFLAGEEVAGAGVVRVDSQGSIKEVSDRSGHYKPGEEQAKQTLEEIERQGVSLDNVQFTMDRGEESTHGMAREFLQGQVTPEEQLHRAQVQQSGQQVSDVSKVMEENFKARHNVADQIKAKGESVRDSLKKTDNLKNVEQRVQEQAKKQGVGHVK